MAVLAMWTWPIRVMFDAAASKVRFIVYGYIVA